MVVFLGGFTFRCLHLTRALSGQCGHRIRLMSVMTTTSEQDMSGHGDQGEDGDNLGAHDSLQYGRCEGNVLRRTSNIYRANSVPSIIICSKSANAVRRKLVGAGHARRLIVASNGSHFDGTLVKRLQKRQQNSILPRKIACFRCWHSKCILPFVHLPQQHKENGNDKDYRNFSGRSDPSCRGLTRYCNGR